MFSFTATIVFNFLLCCSFAAGDEPISSVDLYKLQVQIETLDTEVKQVQRQNQDLNHEQELKDEVLKTLVDNVQELETENQELSNELKTAKEQASQLKEESQAWANNVVINQDVLTELKKIQSGSYDCRNYGWKGGPHFKTKDVKISFPKPYKNSPSVHVSLAWINDDAEDEDNEFGVELGTVTNSYFIMRCKNWKTSTNHNLVGTWISAPKF